MSFCISAVLALDVDAAVVIAEQRRIVTVQAASDNRNGNLDWHYRLLNFLSGFIRRLCDISFEHCFQLIHNRKHRVLQERSRLDALPND